MSISIGGLGSGIDAQGLVNQLMQAEAGAQSKLKAAKSALTVKSGAWLTLANLTKTLQDKATGLQTPQKLQLTSSTSNAPTTATVTSTPTATPGTLTFRVSQLATRHQVTTTGLSSATDPVGTGSLVVSTGTAGIGATVAVGDGTGVAGKYAVSISLDEFGNPAATVNGEAVDFDVTADGQQSLTVGGATLRFTDTPAAGNAVIAVVQTSATTTLKDVAAELARVEAPVTASVIDDGSAAPHRLVLAAVDSGRPGAFLLTPSTGVAAALTGTPLVEAQNARLQIGDDATAITLERPTNTVTDLMPGVTINLVKASTDPVTVDVKKDDDAVLQQVKGLQDAVNGLLTWISTNSKYDVAAKRGGPMVGDAAVRTLGFQVLDAMRTTTPDGTYGSAGAIGLSLNRTGTYELDQDKLRAALKADPTAVAALVSGIATAVATVTKSAQEGEGLIRTGQTSTESRSRDLQNRIDAWDVRLLAIKKRYDRQFSGLDVAMSKMNSQSTWLAGQIKGLNAGS